uniref:DUF38 domain-containing protein n=1 Tax=Panagrolaimus sp. JU765 TaxID=591449 RepID=A0AC34QEN4_9BILA
MSKRHGDDAADDVPSKKANPIENVDEIEKKLLNAEREMEELQAVIANNKVRVEGESVFNCNQEMNEKRSADLELTNQLEVVKESILKMKSQKNRLLNPVCLSSDLYADIFKEANPRKITTQLEDVLKFFLIGKEAERTIAQLMKQCVQIDLYDDVLYFNNFRLTYCKFSENLIKLIIPYVTKVNYRCENPENFHRSFFETLFQNQEQKSLTISDLNHANDIVVEALKKLNDKKIPIKLSYPEKEVLLDLFGVHFDILEIEDLDYSFKKWFHFLATNSLPCTFTKLQLPHVELRSKHKWGKEVVVNVRELLITWDFNLDDDFFGRLNKHFPNAQKLTVTFLKTFDRRKFFNELKYSQNVWNHRKNYITNAPQKEIVANFSYVTNSKRKYEKAIKLFGGKEIENNSQCHQWTSPTNNSKIINFHHKLTAEINFMDEFWGSNWGSDINSESGLSNAEIDPESDFDEFDISIDFDVDDL